MVAAVVFAGKFLVFADKIQAVLVGQNQAIVLSLVVVNGQLQQIFMAILIETLIVERWIN